MLLLPHILKQKLLRRSNKISKDELLMASTVQGIVLPFDLDLHLHMNNSKYLREMDFGRILHYVQTKFYHNTRAVGGNLVVSAATIRYRRSLQLWQCFSLQTQILCWKDDSIYMEQRFVDRSGFVCAVALLQMCVRGATLENILEKLCTTVPQSPPFPPEVQSWEETISKSKEKMRKERTSN